MDRCSRWGKQEHDRMEILLGSHHFLLIMKHTPPPLVLPASTVLSIHKTEKLSDGITAVSGTEVVSHVSDKQRILQSLTSRWKLILALTDRPSYFPTIEHWWAGYSVEEDCEPFPSFCCGSQRVSCGASWSVTSGGYASGHCSPPRSGVSQVATLDSWIKCLETG